MVLDAVEVVSLEVVTTVFGLLPSLALAVVVAVVGTCAVNRVLRFVHNRMNTRLDLNPLVFKFLVYAAKIMLKCLLYTTVLTILSIDVTSMLCLLSIFSVSVATASKPALKNVVGGLLLLVRKPFREGDLIDVSGQHGHVMGTRLFDTKMRLLDNKLASIPNSNFQTNVVVNYTKLPNHRVDIPVCVTYEADLDAAEAEILSVAAQERLILHEPQPVVLVNGFGEVGVELVLRCWVENKDSTKLNFSVNRAIQKAFDSAGIGLAQHRCGLATTII